MIDDFIKQNKNTFIKNNANYIYLNLVFYKIENKTNI